MNAKPPPGMSTIRGLVASDLAAFDAHKRNILDKLVAARTRGSGADACDTEKAWHDLVHIAEWFFWRERTKREAVPNAKRVKQLQDFAEALALVRTAAQNNELINDVFIALHENANRQAAANQKLSYTAVASSLDALNGAVGGVIALEIAARSAATAVRRPGGRPKGTAVLPPEYIVRLAILFRSNTGKRPGSGDGPFALFVAEFLTAVGQRTAYSTVIGAIRAARNRSLQSPSGWPPSPFG